MRTDNYQFVRELAELGLRRRRERGDSLTVELIKHEVEKTTSTLLLPRHS